MTTLKQVLIAFPDVLQVRCTESVSSMFTTDRLYNVYSDDIHLYVLSDDLEAMTESVSSFEPVFTGTEVEEAETDQDDRPQVLDTNKVDGRRADLIMANVIISQLRAENRNLKDQVVDQTAQEALMDRAYNELEDASDLLAEMQHRDKIKKAAIRSLEDSIDILQDRACRLDRQLFNSRLWHAATSAMLVTAAAIIFLL